MLATQEWVKNLLSKIDTEVSADKVSYTNEQLPGATNVADTLDKLISKIYYVAPSVTSFNASTSGGNFEIGSTVGQPIAFAWATNKDIVSQTLTDLTITATDRSAVYTKDITSNKTFTLKIVDDTGASASKSISYNFYPRIYYGVAALPETVDNAFVLGLENKDLKSNRSGTYSMNVTTGNYGFWCSPTRYGTPNCKIGGFDTELPLVTTINLTNASGYKEDYYVYRTPNSGLGSISLVIS